MIFFLISLGAKSTSRAERPEDISYLCASEKNQLSFNTSIIPLQKSTLTVLTWNAHKFADPQYFIDLKKISKTSDIIFIQEAMHSSGWQKAFSTHMTLDWSFHKSFCIDDQSTGVLTGSRYPLMNSQTIVSPGTEPLSFTPKVSGISFIQFQNKKIMLINTHALNFNLGSDFEDQVDQIIQIISQTDLPVIWSGDFNTWSPGRRSYLFNQAMSQGLDPLIPKNDNRTLKLDHILVRGFRSVSTKVLEKYKSSDHFPVVTELVLQ